MTSNIGATEHHQFYGDGVGAAAVAVDLSGNGNCTAGATHIYQSSFDYGVPGTVMVEIELETGVTPPGIIFARYSGTTRQAIRWNNGEFLLIVNNATAHTLPAVSDGTFLCHWSMAVDPLDPTRTRSEVRIWELDGTPSFMSGVSWTHDTPDLDGVPIVWGALVTSGTGGTGGTLLGAGFLLHDTSHLQVYRDRVAMAAAPTLEGDTSMEVPMPSRGSNLGGSGRPAGPTLYVAAGAVNANRLLLASPLVNVQWHEPDHVTYGSIGSLEWWAESPTGDGYIGLPWTWRRPVPRTVDKVKVRAYVSSSRSGATNENSVTLTALSCDRNPAADSEDDLLYYSANETFGPVNDSATSTHGRWVEFESVRIARNANDMTWLHLGVEVTGASATEQTVTVYAVTIEPLSVNEEDDDAIGGIGFG